MKEEPNLPVWLRPKRLFGRVSPGPFLFIVAVALIVLGLIVPALSVLLKVGLFIILFFILLLAIAIIFQIIGASP